MLHILKFLLYKSWDSVFVILSGKGLLKMAKIGKWSEISSIIIPGKHDILVILVNIISSVEALFSLTLVGK